MQQKYIFLGCISLVFRHQLTTFAAPAQRIISPSNATNVTFGITTQPLKIDVPETHTHLIVEVVEPGQPGYMPKAGFSAAINRFIDLARQDMTTHGAETISPDEEGSRRFNGYDFTWLANDKGDHKPTYGDLYYAAGVLVEHIEHFEDGPDIYQEVYVYMFDLGVPYARALGVLDVCNYGPGVNAAGGLPGPGVGGQPIIVETC